METNIDNTNIPRSDVEENAESPYFEDTNEVVEEVVETVEQPEVDEDKEAAELAGVADEEEESTEEVVEPVVAKSATTHTLSKEESKIVALKRQNQKLLDDYRSLQSRLDEIESTKQHATLKSEYINRGMDEDYADQLAKKDLEAKVYATKLEVLEFKLDNEDILRKYPDSKKDLQRIMGNVKSTGMTVEQVCRGLYGLEPEREVRAKQAAKGELAESEPDTSVSKAQRSSEVVTTTTLSAKDLAKKKEYEQMWRSGAKMPNEEWLSIKKQYKF